MCASLSPYTANWNYETERWEVTFKIWVGGGKLVMPRTIGLADLATSKAWAKEAYERRLKRVRSRTH